MSITTVPIATKIGKLVTHLEELLSFTSYIILIT